MNHVQGTSGPAETAERQPQLVVLRALGMGDLLTALPALRGLAAAFPDHRRVLVGPAALAWLVGDAVDEVVDADLRRGFAPLPRSLASPDVAVNLHGRGPESTRVLQALGPGRLIAVSCAEAGVDGPEWRDDEHEVARWCRLLADSGIPTDPTRLGIDVAPDPAAAGATIVHPGSASPTRRWPPERWAAVARALAADGERVLVTGDPGEVDLARSVADGAGLPAHAVLAGRTDIAGLAALVAGARRLVCADTGVGHLATATGTPSVVLFGPVPPSEWGPPPLARHRTLWGGRRSDPSGRGPAPALLAISVGDVLAALQALRATPRPR